MGVPGIDRHGKLRSSAGVLPILCALAFSGIPAKAQEKPPVQVAPCKASQLSATEDQAEADSVEGGLGHHAKTFAIRNRSVSLCVLEGVPTLTLADKANRSLRASVCSNCPDYLFASQPVRRIVLKPNQSAYLVIAYNINDGVGECREAATLGFHLRDQREPLNVNVVQGRDEMRSCGGLDITPFLAKPPVDGFLPR
jgi:hypothetical protein